MTKKDCSFKNTCKKYLSNNCVDNDEVCIKLFKLDFLYQNSLLSEHQRKYTPMRIDADGTDREEFTKLKFISEHIEEFVNKGKSLYIFSSKCGNGKTLWSTRLIQDYFNSIWHKCDLSCKGLFISVPKFLLALKDNISSKNDYVEHIKQNVLDADIVVWDEIGTKAVTTFEHEHLLSLINARIDNNKTNIFTSNLSPIQLKESVGERLYSRVINLSDIIEFKGSDKRGVNL